ncbi:glycerol-3-phosphate dehydrogenase [Rheinheimera sp. UJ63]|uniref:glycerol-3-phosphate dehydrogenase n=1 Tax=Rheinheimera sp. UJ63 TaxID=2910157 RepID=UPI001F2B1F51|nr:glycerol-3-phosphate dehydrogenase [Rheinheimera sp. UJ63]MCF4008710.1 glycerol-3-phosphate dehydrogenase [Rheinheimera sp. UJ63]
MKVDVVVIGGGVNGTGIAHDAAGRGLKVLLCEQADLASATSSKSSKLIHGGLRYLEHFEFSLVRKALAEREILLKNAPHIMWPLTFCLPYQAHLRPVWMIWLGLFLYDHLTTRRKLPASRKVHFDATSPLESTIKVGFEYADGWVDDARLVILNACAARSRGASIYTHTRCIQAQRLDDYWCLTLRHQDSGDVFTVHSKAVVNATGPWVSQLFSEAFAQPSPQAIRLVKGSHIVVPRLHLQPQAYILQNEDQRIVFAIPYEDHFTLIGTTDVEYQGDPAAASISAAETAYLLAVINHYFKQKITEADIVHSFAGVRPLLEDASSSAQSVTRDYKILLDSPDDTLPLLSVFGGKITTYRTLAESVVDQLAPFFPQQGPRWTAASALPGGDFTDQAALKQHLLQHYPWLAPSFCQRLVRTYGTLSFHILAEAQTETDLGQHFFADLWQAEVDYLRSVEWARCAEDILWRRTKLGLQATPEQVQALTDYLQHHPHPTAT